MSFEVFEKNLTAPEDEDEEEEEKGNRRGREDEEVELKPSDLRYLIRKIGRIEQDEGLSTKVKGKEQLPLWKVAEQLKKCKKLANEQLNETTVRQICEELQIKLRARDTMTDYFEFLEACTDYLNEKGKSKMKRTQSTRSQRRSRESEDEEEAEEDQINEPEGVEKDFDKILIPKLARQIEDKNIDLLRIGKRLASKKHPEFCDRRELFKSLKDEGLALYKDEISMVQNNVRSTKDLVSFRDLHDHIERYLKN